MKNNFDSDLNHHLDTKIYCGLFTIYLLLITLGEVCVLQVLLLNVHLAVEDRYISRPRKVTYVFAHCVDWKFYHGLK